MPTAVLMRIGQIEVMKMTKIAEGWPSRNAASDKRQPGQRRHGAQHLEDRVEAAHGRARLADAARRARRRPPRRARSRAPRAAGWPAGARTGPCRARHGRRTGAAISSQLSVSTLVGRRQASTVGPRSSELPDSEQDREHDQRRQQPLQRPRAATSSAALERRRAALAEGTDRSRRLRAPAGFDGQRLSDRPIHAGSSRAAGRARRRRLRRCA